MSNALRGNFKPRPSLPKKITYSAILVTFPIKLPTSNICCLFSWRYNPLWFYFHSLVAGFSLLVLRGFLITCNDEPQWVGLLWTSVAETST
jgi:hypothetical protein